MTSRQVILIVVAILLLISATFLFHSITGNVQAQNSNFSDLIAALNRRVEQENGFIFQIILANYSNPEAEVIKLGEGEYEISEVGSDYVCVNRAAGAALTKSCIPFTNIAAVTYLDN